MSEYTKGKWKVQPDGLTIKSKIEYEPHYDAEPPQILVAKCFQNGHLGKTIRPTEEDFANARLIAAAPDLLEACLNSPAPNMIAFFADFAEECTKKPSMAVYKSKFVGLATFLRSCKNRAERMQAVIIKAKKE